MFDGAQQKDNGGLLSDLGIGSESTVDVRRMLVCELEDDQQRARLIEMMRSNELETAEFEISFMSDR